MPTLPSTLDFVVDATAQYTAAASTQGIPIAGVAKFLTGVIETPVAITGAGGTFDLAHPVLEPVGAHRNTELRRRPGGYPVVLFGHGFLRSRNDTLAIASTLTTAGQVVIATDLLFHGERSSCTGSKAATGQSTDDASCADPTNQTCNESPLIGRCVARADATRTACGPSTGPTGDRGVHAQCKASASPIQCAKAATSCATLRAGR